MAVDKIAVLFVHGVEVPDEHYAEGAIARLRAEVGRATGDPGSAERLEIEPAYWIPAVAAYQDLLVARVFPAHTSRWFSTLNRLVHRVNIGSTFALLQLFVSGVLPKVPFAPRVDWPTLKWAFTYFVGDVVAYQVTENQREVYDAIQASVTSALDKLGQRAPSGPLCVISHSLGTVVASDYFYDLLSKKQGSALPSKQDPALPERQDPAAPGTALERGETLTFFYTLGSPIALWMIRYGKLDCPIQLPGKNSADPQVRDAAQWINFYDPADIVAYPLKHLSSEYDCAVDEDRAVNVGPPILRRTPISHIAYWNDSKVMRPIAQRLAQLLTAPTPTD